MRHRRLKGKHEFKLRRICEARLVVTVSSNVNFYVKFSVLLALMRPELTNKRVTLDMRDMGVKSAILQSG